MRRLLSTCFSNVERNTPYPWPKTPAEPPKPTAPGATGLTWDELGNNDTNARFAVKTKMSHGLVTQDHKLSTEHTQNY
jgi:hypothetical protein